MTFDLYMHYTPIYLLTDVESPSDLFKGKTIGQGKEMEESSVEMVHPQNQNYRGSQLSRFNLKRKEGIVEGKLDRTEGI